MLARRMVRPLVRGLCGKLFRVPSVDASDSLKVTAQTHSIVKRTDGTGTKNMSELLAKSKENFLLLSHAIGSQRCQVLCLRVSKVRQV